MPTAATGFDDALTPIDSYSQGSAAGGYVVRAGDSLAAIAANLWGDASLWYKLAQANGIASDSGLIPGMTLAIPAGVMRNTHNASTFAPYDPTDAYGDTSPTTPNPQAAQAKKKGNKCGLFGQVLLVAVAVAVTALSHGALAALGPIGSGAAAGAAGSIASQGVGLATGIQDKFSFKQVALAGIAGGVGGALQGSGLFGQTVDGTFKAGSLGIGSRLVDGALRGVAGNLLNQGVALATGLQSKFDFAAVAVGGAVGGAASRFPGGGPLSRFGSGSAGAISGAAARSLLTGSDFGDNLIRALPDVIGSTVGGAVTAGIQRASMPAGGSLALASIPGILPPATAEVDGQVTTGSGEVVVTASRRTTEPGLLAKLWNGLSDTLDSATGWLLDGIRNSRIVQAFSGLTRTNVPTAHFSTVTTRQAVNSALATMPIVLPTVAQRYGWDRANLSSSPYRDGWATRQQYMMGDGSVFTGTTRELDNFQRQRNLDAGMNYVDRVGSSPMAGISLGIARGMGTSPATQDLVFGLTSSAEGMSLAIAGLRGATLPGSGNQRTLSVINGENGIHANSRLSGRTTYLYELQTKTGEFLKYGISVNPDTRYSTSFMADKRIDRITSGTRADMIELERQMVISNPGPLNKERWAINVKRGK